MGTRLSRSYGPSLAIWNHTALLATRHWWTCLFFTALTLLVAHPTCNNSQNSLSQDQTQPGVSPVKLAGSLKVSSSSCSSSSISIVVVVVSDWSWVFHSIDAALTCVSLLQNFSCQPSMESRDSSCLLNSWISDNDLDSFFVSCIDCHRYMLCELQASLYNMMRVYK